MAASSLARVLTWTVSLVLLVSAACVPPQTDDDDDAGQPKPPEDPKPLLVGAESLSWHYVEVVFDREVDAGYADPELYIIKGPTGEFLKVSSAQIQPNTSRVLLVTGPQREMQYELSLDGSAGSVVDESGAVTTMLALFKGSTQPEPFVASAIALSSTSVLVTYDGAMDDNISLTSSYEIVQPDLDVLSATSGSADTTALLVTSEQENVDYTVRVTDVTSGDGTRLLDPNRSTAVFNGIGLEEPPVVIGAVALNATTVLVSFNKPLADDAADPTLFSISPDLVITSAEASLFNTQIRLTTLPMTAGQTYTVTAGDVRDRDGVLIAEPPGNQATFTFDGQPQTGPTEPLDLPRVVGAGSLGNTSVMVIFNKPMGDNALDPVNYIIVQENVNSEVGALAVLNNVCAADSANAGAYCSDNADCGGGLCLERAPHFLDASRTTVVLTTSSQNEVTYRVKVINARDLAGNELAPQQLLVDPTSATFPGTPPSGDEFVDSDGDGLSDNAELRGYVVVTIASNGEISRTEVTSDPNNPDTDGDGLDDAEERQINTNPRSVDTDGDRISDYDEFNIWYSSPLHQDTDADELDDRLEIFFFKTSALLADTDGDGLADGDEVVAGNRNPRISDLPEPAISIGEVALRLDTRFSYTDTEGVSQSTQKSNTATLTESEQTTFATSDTETMKHVIEAGFEGGLDQGKGTAKGKINYNFTYETTFTANQESVSATQSEFQESLTTAVERDITKEVNRTVEGASIDLAVSLSNFGDIPFTMNNLEITAVLQDPFNRRRFLPVASLLPSSQLQTGQFEVFLGPFIQERGPFIFRSTEVFPSLVEDLMKNPRGLIFKVANFDVVDEQGRNFAFISQDVNDRTAGLIIDYGNGEVDRFRIATHDRFNDTGQPTGITMAYALQDILALPKNAAQDAIAVGPNGCAETFASGDDIQVVVPICSPVTPGGVIIEPGPNGVLESIPTGDDRKSDDGLRIIDGGDGCAHTRARRDDVQVVPGDCAAGDIDGVVILAGPNGAIDSTPAGDDELAAVSGYGTELIGTCDGMTTDTHQIIEPPFGGNGIANSRVRNGTDDVQVVPVGTPVQPREVIIEPGSNGILESQPIGDEIRLGPGALAETDGDCPGGGSVRKIERLVRVKGVRNLPAEARLWVVIGPPDMNVGANFDELPLQAGRTYSLAYVQDQDMDGLYAQEEYLYGSSDRDENSDGCPLGDGAPGCDTNLYDFDTLRDFEEVKTGWEVQVAGLSSYVTFANPVQPDSDADRLFDDEELTLGTDPGKRDTDSDDISDYDEVRGYSSFRRDGQLIRHVVPYQSAIITPGQNGALDSIRVGDDVMGQDSLSRSIITPGPNGLLDSVADKDDRIEGTAVILDGGNGIPETTASVGDEQVGPSPASTRNVTVTFVDYQPGGNSCDATGPGEFRFNLRVRKGVDTLVGTPHVEKAVIDRFDTHYFGGVIVDNGNGVCNTTAVGDDVQVVTNGGSVTPGAMVVAPGPDGELDTTPGGDDIIVAPRARYSTTVGWDDRISLSAAILEDDPTCDAHTRSIIAEPAGGNHVADTLADGDDRQIVPFGHPADSGETIIDSCPANTDGVLNTMAGIPGLCEEVIVAGADGTADTIAAAGTDDVQVAAPGTDSLDAGAVVIAPGPNGRIDTVPAGADEFVGAMVPRACEPIVVEPAGGDGVADTLAAGDDIQVIASGAAVAPGTVIIRPGPNGVIDAAPAGDDERVPSSLAPGGDCDACPSGACIASLYDCSVCPSAACYGDDVVVARAEGDSCEEGWLLADADIFCPCGACREFDSTPTPSAHASWSPQSMTLDMDDWSAVPPEGAIVTFANGPDCFSAATLRVRVEVTQGTSVTPGAVLVRAGTDGVLDTVPFGDDVIGVPHLFLYASNPLDRDTDGDTLFDGAERILGANPDDARDAQRFRDNDLDGLANGVELDGWFLGYTDAVGSLQCLTESGTMEVLDEFDPPHECRMVTSDPFEPDTDFDGLPDLLEYLLRSDPRSPDTDGDGLLDYDEFNPASRFSIPVLTFREFERRCFETPRCTFTPAESPHGTSVVLADTDQDGRTDREEIEEHWIVAPCITQQGGGQIPGVPRAVYSSPLEPDFDLDGLPDGLEKAMFLDPADSDTDGDGIVDSLDEAPDGCGKRITLTFVSYAVRDDCDGTGDGEFRFRLRVTTPAGSVLQFDMNADNLDDNETHAFPSTFSTTFAIRPGQTFQVWGTVLEDDASGDEVWNFSRTFDFSSVTGQQTISPAAGEANDGCFDDHSLSIQFTVGQL